MKIKTNKGNKELKKNETKMVVEMKSTDGQIASPVESLTEKRNHIEDRSHSSREELGHSVKAIDKAEKAYE